MFTFGYVNIRLNPACLLSYCGVRTKVLQLKIIRLLKIDTVHLRINSRFCKHILDFFFFFFLIIFLLD